MSWMREHFARRSYSVVGQDLDDASRIEVIVKVDKRTVIHMQAREPGMLAIVSRPDSQGIDVESLEVDRDGYTDYRLPNGERQEVPDWMMHAIGIPTEGNDGQA